MANFQAQEVEKKVDFVTLELVKITKFKLNQMHSLESFINLTNLSFTGCFQSPTLQMKNPVNDSI